MNWQREEARRQIREKIAELAAEIGHNALALGDDDIIPKSGVLDSAGILGLIVWCENQFGTVIDLEEVSIDNFGSVNLILDFLEKSAGPPS